MNRPPHRPQPRATFSPAEAAVLLAVGLLILAAAGFAAVAVLGVLNPRPAQPVIASAGQPDAPASQPPAAKTPAPPAAAPASLPLGPTQNLSQTAPPPAPAACTSQDAENRIGLVIDVLSGDTLLVLVDGVNVTVGYAGVEAPALTDAPAGAQALEANRQLIGGQVVTLVKEAPEVDDGGRLLRYVFFLREDGTEIFANQEVARMGYARATALPTAACADVLRAAEQAARTGLIGMWSPTPIPTATFYPTVGYDPNSQAACTCGVRWECSDFRSRAAAQACYNACNDYNSRLDEDRDGLACEHLP